MQEDDGEDEEKGEKRVRVVSARIATSFAELELERRRPSDNVQLASRAILSMA